MLQHLKTEKKRKEKEKKEMEVSNRKHLANVRVIQKTLVYIIGFHEAVANSEVG